MARVRAMIEMRFRGRMVHRSSENVASERESNNETTGSKSSVVLFACSGRAPRTHERVSKYQRFGAKRDRRASRVAARGPMPEPGFRTPFGAQPRNSEAHAEKRREIRLSDVARNQSLK